MKPFTAEAIKGGIEGLMGTVVRLWPSLVSLAVMGFFCLFWVVPIHAAQIRDIRFSRSAERTRFVVEFDRMPEIKMGILKDPFRVYFDLYGTGYSFGKNLFRFSWKEVRTLRLGRQHWGIRMVFDLKAPVKWKFFTLKSPPRLVLDIFHGENHTGQAERPSKKDATEVLPPQWVVVVDPGHGGHDPGAIGPGGLREKDITLKIARLVKEVLQKRYHVKVVLTRETDRYIGLKDRTRIANRAGADLFVSIHLNAHRDHRVRGLETYLLNWTTDEEALRVAARENKISLKEMKRRQGELSVILASLRRSAKRDHSLKLAYFMHSEILKRVAKKYRVPNNGIKQALFYVLVGAEMPSVLVELAYISNPVEAKLLQKGAVQRAYAEAIARAVYRYLMSLPEAPKLAMARGNLTKYD